MAPRRTKSIGTKVTPEEYDRIRELAGEQPVSEWVRVALLKAAADTPAVDSIILAELLALRAILLNLHFHMCSGTPVTAETMQRLIERADQDKRQKVQARLGSVRRSSGRRYSSPIGDQTLTDLGQPSLITVFVVFIAGLLIAIPKDVRWSRSRRHGRRLKGPELVSVRQFNSRTRAKGDRIRPDTEPVGEAVRPSVSVGDSTRDRVEPSAHHGRLWNG